MSNLYYEATYTPALEATINQRPAVKQLASEMFYKYGLRIMDWSNQYGAIMTTDGLPHCAVSYSATEYQYYSRYEKARGKSSDDRRTLRSVKLSSLMKTIEKNGAVNTDWQNIVTASVFNGMRDQLIRSIKGSGGKNPSIGGESMHKLLKHLFDGSPLPEEVKRLCQEELDKFNSADNIRIQRMARMNKYFLEPFTMIAVSPNLRGYAIAKLKLLPNEKGNVITDSYLDKENIELVEPWHRVVKLEDYEKYDEIVAPLTMLNILTESAGIRLVNGLPQTDAYWNSGALSYYTNFSDMFGISCTLIPNEVD